MSHMSVATRAMLIAAIAIPLMACSPGEEEAGQQAPPTEEPDTEKAAAAIDQPLDKNQVGASYEVDTAGVRMRDSTVLRIPVRVTNTGRATLVSNGAYPVRLGAMLVNANGEVVRRDFVRASVGELPPGESMDVVVEVPAKEVVGNSVRFDLVQERVSWFSSMGQQTVDYGPVSECATGDGSLCGPDGTAIAAR